MFSFTLKEKKSPLSGGLPIQAGNGRSKTLELNYLSSASSTKAL